VKRSPAYFLSHAVDVNLETLRRLAPEAPPSSPQQDLHALVAIDWDDTLFPTSWCRSGFPEAEELRETAKAAVALLQVARQVGTVVIVTLATEAWVHECIDHAGDEGLSAEVARVRIVSARELQETIEVWPRRNESPQSARNFGVLLGSRNWELELRAQMVNSKMAAMRSGMQEGCRQLISIGDSEIERWAAHDMPFSADPACAGVLVKTIKFQEELSNAALCEVLRTTVSLLGQFARLNVEMDVNLRSGDDFFPMDLQFAMQTFYRESSLLENQEPSSPTPASKSPLGLSRRSNRKTESWKSHEI
jgi:hypothetical protein